MAASSACASTRSRSPPGATCGERGACARRELAEETGFAPGALRRLGGFFTAPGFCTEYIHAFLATDLRPERTDGDEDEELEAGPLSLDEPLACCEPGP